MCTPLSQFDGKNPLYEKINFKKFFSVELRETSVELRETSVELRETSVELREFFISQKIHRGFSQF
jgi:hypothetical protein